jgi:hypothetical protein
MPTELPNVSRSTLRERLEAAYGSVRAASQAWGVPEGYAKKLVDGEKQIRKLHMIALRRKEEALRRRDGSDTPETFRHSDLRTDMEFTLTLADGSTITREEEVFYETPGGDAVADLARRNRMIPIVKDMVPDRLTVYRAVMDGKVFDYEKIPDGEVYHHIEATDETGGETLLVVGEERA